MTGAIEQEQYENERWLAVTDWMASRPAALDRPLLSASAFAAGADWFKARAAVEAAKPAPEAPSYELSSKETGALNRALLRSVKFEPAPEPEPLRAALRDAWAGFVNLSSDMEPGPLRQQMRKHAGRANAALEAALSHSAPETAPVEADMPAICAALGFDPTNHHNAAKCPYCRPAAPVEAK